MSQETVESLRIQLEVLKQATHREPFICKACGQWDVRLIKDFNKKQYCDEPKCKKIAKLGTEKPVSLSDSYTGRPKINTADINYHGTIYQ